MRQLGRAKAIVARQERLPDEAAYLWAWWCELDHARGGNGFEASPLTFTEIGEWARLMRIDIDPWEVRAIRTVDDAYRNAKGGGE